MWLPVVARRRAALAHTAEEESPSGVRWRRRERSGACRLGGAYAKRLRMLGTSSPNVRHAEHLRINGFVAERSLTVDLLEGTTA